MMPFHNGNEAGEKKAFLDYLRIKYIIENKLPSYLKQINRNKQDENCPSISYTVSYFKTGVGNIAEQASKYIANSDLFIALINEANINVIYEIAVLNMLQENLILLLDLNTDQEKGVFLPVYVKDHAHISFYDNGENRRDHHVQRKIDELSKDSATEIVWEQTYIDDLPELKKDIDEYDNRLGNELASNINEYEHGRIAPPAYFRKLIEGFHPSNALSSWVTYIPYSVIKINWKKQQDDGTYLSEDLDGEAEITWCNNEFCRLLEKPEDPEALLSGIKLTISVQMKLLGKNIDPEKLAILSLDQKRVFEELFLNNKKAQAWVPIELNDGHSQFSNRIFLPTMIAKRAVGSLKNPHSAYYIIAFIEDFYPIEEISKSKLDLLKERYGEPNGN